MALDYDHSENHVDHRSLLSDTLRQRLFAMPREAWRNHPRFHGEPAFWLQIHQGLLGASGQLKGMAEAFCGDMADEDRPGTASQIHQLGGQLVHHAHGHHHIEDHHFFPVFLEIFPQLADPLELLDGDHKVLSEVLNDIEQALQTFPAAPQGDDKARRDAWLAAGERLLPASRRLDALFHRHIGDEEEICVPALLQL